MANKVIDNTNLGDLFRLLGSKFWRNDSSTTQVIGIDSIPVKDSTNLITSGAVYSIMDEIETALNALL
jgi:hypothetical protein